MENNTLKYFNQITKIPRESGNEAGIVDFLQDFAKQHNFEYCKDKNKNIIIFKNKNCKNKIILQAHTDMVCVSNNSNFDFQKQPIKIKINGDILSAQNTTLGADNGLGVSAILSLLCEDLPLGMVAIFTSEEETTMNGAKTVDKKYFCANNLVSFDGDNSNTIEIASAGIVQADVKLCFEKYKNIGETYKITISNLTGGHSGSDIDKNRTNAIKFCANLAQKYDAKIISLCGGTKSNAIANSACMIVQMTSKTDIEKTIPEPNAKLEVEYIGKQQADVFGKNFTSFLCEAKHGVLERYLDGFVKTSQNIAIVDTDKNLLVFSLRSSNKQSEQYHLKQFEKFVKSYNCKMENVQTNPFFETDPKCELVKNLQKSYQNLFDDIPQLKRVHAGLEGGVFVQKNPKLNIAVLGFDIWDMHSPNERVSLKSVDKIYLWAYHFLKDYSKQL